MTSAGALAARPPHGPDAPRVAQDQNGYAARVDRVKEGWRVVILDPAGAVASERPCADQDEAELFASTVRQHIGWLSQERFRAYYRLPEPGV